jgi:sugar (pentulose or hexulose) kinase
MGDELVLGIDLGTSYFKLGLFDRAGQMRGLGRIAVLKDTGDGSLCELPVTRFQRLLREGLRQACEQAEVSSESIRAASYSSQANSFLLLGQQDEPLTPLILWPDARVLGPDPVVRELGKRPDFLSLTAIGFPVSAQFGMSKVRWFQTNHPDIWGQSRRFMTISDYLTFTLTGERVGDAGTAALLGILDLERLRWWEKALQKLEIPVSYLSAPLRPGVLAGRVTQEGERILGLKRGIPFSVGSLDHHVAATGAGAGRIAEISESTGTVLACLCLTQKYTPKTGCCMGPGLFGYDFYQLSFADNGASALEWYRDTYAPEYSLEELGRMAEAVDLGSDGLMALPMANRYHGRDGFKGISHRHLHGHFVRALMESTAASLLDLVKDLNGSTTGSIVATGGGARSDLWLQIKADMMGTDFVTTDCSEPACLGAAIFAALGAGWFSDLEEASASWITVQNKFTPDTGRQEIYSRWLEVRDRLHERWL